jgi:hypothetical protein
MLEDGRRRSIVKIAKAEKIDHSFFSRLLRLTLPALDIQEAILKGCQAKGIQLEELNRAMPGKRGGQRVRGENSNSSLADFTDHLRQRFNWYTSFGLNSFLVQSTQLPEIPTAKGATIVSYATMHDIHHLLEADRPDEPRRPIPAPVAERDKSDEPYASGHEPKAQVGTDWAA